MIGKELLSKKPIGLVNVQAMLKERKSEKDLSYEQKLTYEYSKKFSKLTPAKHKKIMKELQALESISEDLAVKIADVLPDSMVLMNLIANKQDAKEEDLKKALEIVKGYLKS